MRMIPTYKGFDAAGEMIVRADLRLEEDFKITVFQGWLKLVV